MDKKLCLKDGHYEQEISYVCVYYLCQQCRLLCYQCKLDFYHKHNQQDDSHIIDKNQYDQQQQQIKQSIRNAKYQISQFEKLISGSSQAISNDTRYVALEPLKIWDCQKNDQIKEIPNNWCIMFCKFTDDTKLLYVGTFNQKLYQLDVQKQFKILRTYYFNTNLWSKGWNVYCNSRNLIFTLSVSGTITKTHLDQNKQSLKIKANCYNIHLLDYNKSLNIIATGSEGKIIKVWNTQNGSILFEKYMSLSLQKLQFIKNYNQLISLDDGDQIIIWNINFQKKQLEFYKLLKGKTFQLILDQQFILTTSVKQCQIFSIDGEFVRLINHHLIQISISKIYQKFLKVFIIIILQFDPKLLMLQ